jgi:hypothetical protein
VSGRALLAGVALALALMSGLAATAHAEDAPLAPTPEELFQRGARALQRGEYGAAIDALEALSDQGFTHPDASYDRGVAYVSRVRARAARPGDLGRAAAAFAETLLLRPEDHDADAALDLVRAEVTRRRARKSKDAVEARPTLDRVIVGLASEQAWGLATIAASALLAVGLVLWRRPGKAHVTGSVLAPTALVALVVLAPLAWGARHLRLTTRPAVVVVSEAYFTDEDGRSRGGEPIPEAALLESSERRGGLVHVRWGGADGWIPTASVRILGM